MSRKLENRLEWQSDEAMATAAVTGEYEPRIKPILGKEIGRGAILAHGWRSLGVTGIAGG